MKTISETIGGAQALLNLNYDLQGCFEERLTAKHKTFLHMIRVLEDSQKPLLRPYAGIGRRPYQYTGFLRSMWAKSFFGLGKTSMLINTLKNDPNLRLLCGFKKVPGRSSFSRAFSYLSGTNITSEILDTLVINTHKQRVVYHVCRDSTAIQAREKRPKKARNGLGKHIKRVKPPSVLKKQIDEPWQVSLEALPKNAAYGRKGNSTWYGYKLHLDVSDCGFPVSAVVTSANVNDSRAAIILEKMTENKVQFCYSLMDSAYDMAAIISFIQGRGRVPIIEKNSRSKNRPPLDPAKQERYKIRTTVERAYSYLKDNLIPKSIYVKGYQKVSFVLMSAVLCLAALRTLQYYIL